MIGDTGSIFQPDLSGSASSSRTVPSPATEARITQLEAELAQKREVVRGLSEHIWMTSGENQSGDGGQGGGDSGAP